MNKEQEYKKAAEVPVPPFLGSVIIVTSLVDRLIRWVFNFSGISFLAFLLTCLFGGLVFFGVANSAVAENDPGSIAAFMRNYWVALFGPSGYFGLNIGSRPILVVTGFVLLIPAWIVLRLVLLPFYFLGSQVKRALLRQPNS